MNTYPIPQYFDEFSLWLQAKGSAEETIKKYVYHLKTIDKDVEQFFANSNLTLPSKKMKITAYRSYLTFLTKKKKVMSRGDLLDALDSLKAPKRRGNNTKNVWAEPKEKWTNIIRMAPHRVAKMAIWLGFTFGLRASEIIHLRVQDIDFNTKELLIRSHKETKTQKLWYPKHRRDRQIPLSKDHQEVLKRWTQERPEDLEHPYLLWTINGPRKGKRVPKRTLQNWCTRVGIHAHVLRYSFATHWYETTKDIKFVSDMLGHSNVSVTSDYLQLSKKESSAKARNYFEQA